MGKKSLAEQIAGLSEPRNDFDIEDSELADPFASSENEASLSDDGHRDHYVPVPKSKMRHNRSLVNDSKYKGTLSSRDALYGGSDGSGGESEGSDAGESEGSSVYEDANQSVSVNSLKSAKAGSEDDESSSADEASFSGEDSGVGSEQSDSEEHSNLAQRSKIKAMMASERKRIVNRLSQSATEDALKGYAVLQQHKQFDALIDARLKLQKAVTNSNLLPTSTLAAERLGLSPKDTKKQISTATRACYDILDTIGSLRQALLHKDNLVDDATAVIPQKRTLDQYVAWGAKQDAVLNQYRGSVLTKWSAKIQNSSGSSAMNASKFKALNQSAEQQVMNNLTDMERLVKRTKLNRRKITPLGHEEPEDKGSLETAEGQASEENEAHTQSQPKYLNMQEMESIFDDEDFYRVLLNDLVDKKIQSSDPTTGLQFALRGAASTKLKKNVDSKASKGRKLRYHTQEPIANFETPRQWLKWNDSQIDEFFASLLGQKISMKEADSSDGEDAGSEDESEIVGNDSIQLFG